MFAESVAITLLCVVHGSVHRARNDTESSEDSIQKCCLDNIQPIDKHQSCYNFTDANRTSATISYGTPSNVSDMCCTTCLGNALKMDDDPERRKANEAETESPLPSPSPSPRRCGSLFASLNFWGANIVIFANIVYIVPYLIVIFVCCVVPGLGTRAYSKVVICYNTTQIALNGILIGLGACVLCHVSIHSDVFPFLGLAIMFLTISSTFWLFFICIDMTLVITRFRWTLPGDANKEEERKKFVTYATWTWCGSLLPTILACVAELSPLLPESSPVRPNFAKFQDGANFAVIIYVATFPAIICLANTVLFCYTSYKMIRIQQSTKLATANNKKSSTVSAVRKRYFVFFKLYLLMDAPWLTSALAAAFTELWILKFLRMIQPILMLLAILPPGTMSRAFSCKSCTFHKSKRSYELEQPIP